MESRKLQGENRDPKQKRKVATKGGDLEECLEVVDAHAHVAQQHTYPFWLKCLQLQETDKDELPQDKVLNGEWLTDKHISAVSTSTAETSRAELLTRQHSVVEEAYKKQHWPS